MVRKNLIFFIVYLLNIIVLIVPFSCKAMCEGAKSAVLIEKYTNKVLYEKNAYQRLPMASTTKIMTALCAIKSGELDKTVTVNANAVGIEGSSIYLQKNEKLTIRELCYGLMLHSGNDAAVAIAYAVSGSVEEFVELMNSTAQAIGAKDTHFDNPNGLDSKTHYTTAYDLALISAYALKNEEFAKIAATKKINIPNGDKGYDRVLTNHNKMLKMYNGCDGIKTGFTKRCGRCLATSATKDGMTLIAVTLNDGNDWNDHIKMLDYGFEHSYLKKVLEKGDYIGMCQVKEGENGHTKLVCDSDVYAVVKDNVEPTIKMEYKISKKIKAPVDYGIKCGKVTIFADGKKISTVNAVTSEKILQKQTHKTMDMFYVLVKSWIDM